ncbi:hypothetical protein PENTCL1PPCAC_24524, partial [Pristionchus entomophagus]
MICERHTPWINALCDKTEVLRKNRYRLGVCTGLIILSDKLCKNGAGMYYENRLPYLETTVIPKYEDRELDGRANYIWTTVISRGQDYCIRDDRSIRGRLLLLIVYSPSSFPSSFSFSILPVLFSPFSSSSFFNLLAIAASESSSEFSIANSFFFLSSLFSSS